MNSRDLTHQQADTILSKLVDTTGYLSRLKARMEKQAFHPTDPLYREVAATQDAMTCLRMRLHYLASGKGVVGE